MKISLPGRFLPLLALLALPAFAAVERTVTITAPPAALPGTDVHVEITARTTARDGEHVGFFQAEYSVDNGKTWIPVYAENLGKIEVRPVNFQTSPAGVPGLVRVRVAFRGGKAGDVDFAGKPIEWETTWGTWSTPPARQATIAVLPR